jgi:16S rRNA (guanine966-N2)-methyltransferase
VGAVTRIIAGSAGGRRLVTPRGAGTRPTSDRVREALFSVLEHELGTLNGIHFLDLYAGSGAVALEAVSRGAASAVLVEHGRRASRAAQDNIRALGLRAASLCTMRVERLVRSAPPEGRRFDVAFLDPPYEVDNTVVVEVLEALRDFGWLAVDALVAVERSTRAPELGWPAGFAPLRSRRYGETRVWYGRATDLRGA